MTLASPLQKTAQVSRMFGRIAARYDLMNRLMSAGQDQQWRRLTARLAEPTADGVALDVATGTGDLALILAQHAGSVVGIDPSAEMVRLGRAKTQEAGRAGQVRFALADALQLPFPTDLFSCVTVAFGVRNMGDLEGAFGEMRRVVHPGGRIACLEIMPPRDGLLGRCYQAYLTRVIPWLGGWVSRQPEAYRYLSDSVVAFHNPQELRAIIEAAGWRSVWYRSLNFGSIAVHVGTK